MTESLVALMICGLRIWYMLLDHITTVRNYQISKAVKLHWHKSAIQLSSSNEAYSEMSMVSCSNTHPISWRILTKIGRYCFYLLLMLPYGWIENPCRALFQVLSSIWSDWHEENAYSRGTPELYDGMFEFIVSSIQ